MKTKPFSLLFLLCSIAASLVAFPMDGPEKSCSTIFPARSDAGGHMRDASADAENNGTLQQTRSSTDSNVKFSETSENGMTEKFSAAAPALEEAATQAAEMRKMSLQLNRSALVSDSRNYKRENWRNAALCFNSSADSLEKIILEPSEATSLWQESTALYRKAAERFCEAAEASEGKESDALHIPAMALLARADHSKYLAQALAAEVSSSPERANNYREAAMLSEGAMKIFIKAAEADAIAAIKDTPSSFGKYTTRDGRSQNGECGSWYRAACNKLWAAEQTAPTISTDSSNEFDLVELRKKSAEQYQAAANSFLQAVDVAIQMRQQEKENSRCHIKEICFSAPYQQKIAATFEEEKNAEDLQKLATIFSSTAHYYQQAAEHWKKASTKVLEQATAMTEHPTLSTFLKKIIDLHCAAATHSRQAAEAYAQGKKEEVESFTAAAQNAAVIHNEYSEWSSDSGAAYQLGRACYAFKKIMAAIQSGASEQAELLKKIVEQHQLAARYHGQAAVAYEQGNKQEGSNLHAAALSIGGSGGLSRSSSAVDHLWRSTNHLEKAILAATAGSSKLEGLWRKVIEEHHRAVEYHHQAAAAYLQGNETEGKRLNKTVAAIGGGSMGRSGTTGELEIAAWKFEQEIKAQQKREVWNLEDWEDALQKASRSEHQRDFVKKTNLRHEKTLEEKINYDFNNKELLTEALTHSSYSTSIKNNQRLELLGDAVLQLVITAHLLERFPDAREGELTKIRATLVSGSTLHDCATSLELDKDLLVGSGERNISRTNCSILGDAFEALTGAIYLDGGLGEAQIFILKFLEEHIDHAAADPEKINPKGHLQEIFQTVGEELPVYELIEPGADRSKPFRCSVSYNKKILGYGEGKNIKEAEKEAAREALKKLEDS